MRTILPPLRWSMLAAAVAALAACSGDPQPASLAFEGAPTSAVAGASVGPFQVKVLDADGQVVDSVRTVTLGLARGDEVVASFSAQAATTNGVASFEGIVLEEAGEGWAFIARSGELPERRSDAFAVAAAAPASLEIVGPATAPIGSTVKFQAVARDRHGNRADAFFEGEVVVETSLSATASVSEPAGGSVDASVTFLQDGLAWLTVRVGDQSATAQVQVQPAGSLAHVDFVLPGFVTAGESLGGSLTVRDEFGNVATGFTGDVTFASSEPSDVLPQDVAFGVDEEGYVSFDGLGFTVAGERVITVTVGGVSATATVTVRPDRVDEIAITGAEGPFVSGQSRPVAVVAFDRFGNRVPYADGAVVVVTDDPIILPVWTYFEADGVATIPGGYALRWAGEQSIRAFYGARSDEVIVTVLPAAPAQLRAHLGAFVAGQSQPVDAGDEKSLLVRVEDEFGNTVKDYQGSVALTGDGVEVPPLANFDAASNGEVAIPIKVLTAPKATVEIDDVAGELPDVTVVLQVKPGKPVSLTATASRDTLVVFEQETLTLTAWDAYGNVATGMNHHVTARLSSSTHQSSLPGDARVDVRFKEANAGVMQIPNLVGYVHEGSFTLSLTSDEGLSTSFDFDVLPAPLPLEVQWSSDVAGARTSLSLSATAGVPVSKAGRVRVTLPANTDFTTAVVTPLLGFDAPSVEFDDDAIVVHLRGGSDDFDFMMPGTLFQLTFDDLRNTTAAGPSGDLRVAIEMSDGALVARGEAGSRDLAEAVLEAVALGPFADETTATVDGRTLTLSGLRAGRGYAFALLEGDEQAMDLECAGPGWLERHDNRLMMELPPFDALQESLSCTTAAGSLTVKLEVAAEPVGIVSHRLVLDADADPSALAWMPPSEDGRLLPVTWRNADNSPVAGVFDTRRGHRFPFPLDDLTTSSSLAYVAGRAPVAAATLHAVSGSALTHDQVAVLDLETGETKIISIDDEGEAGNASSYGPVISRDGRYVLFRTQATNLGGPGYVLFDRLEDKHTPVPIPEGLSPSSGALMVSFSPDATHFTMVGTNPVTYDLTLFVVDMETLTPVAIERGSFEGGRFTRDGQQILISTTTSLRLVNLDGSDFTKLPCAELGLAMCIGTDTTHDGFVLIYGADVAVSIYSSYAVHPVTGEVRLIDSTEGDDEIFIPLSASRSHGFGVRIGVSTGSYQLEMLNLKTSESTSFVAIGGGHLLPVRSRGVSSTPFDDIVVFDTTQNGQSTGLWARTSTGLAQRAGPGTHPVVDATGAFVVSTDQYGAAVHLMDLATGGARNILEEVEVAGLSYGNVDKALGISPGGRWVSIRSKDGQLWIYDAETETFTRREAASPPADGPDEGQGYVAFSPDAATLVRVNPATLGEKALAKAEGLNVTAFHQHALTPDGRFAAYLATTDASSTYEAGVRVFVEEVATGEVRRVDLDDEQAAIPALDAYRSISISADGAYVSFVANNEVYVASAATGTSLKVDAPGFGAALTFATLSGTGRQVFVSKNSGQPDDHLYAFLNPFLLEPTDG